MNKSLFVIYRELRRHRRLAERRSLGNQQNNVAKVVVGIMVAVVVVYLLAASVGLALIANDSRRFTSPECLCICAPVIFLIDFLMRFTVQQTPSQIVKPYLLLPLPKDTCINSVIAASLLSWGNAVWLVLVVPFCIMAVLFSYGVWPCVLLTAYFWLLAMANSQWYAIVRTLINDSMAWWLLPVSFYALLLAPPLLADGAFGDAFMAMYEFPGTGICDGSVLPIAAALGVLLAVTAVNRRVQRAHIISEVQADNGKELRTVRQYRFLDRFGDMGQYMKLELRLISRNKNPRKQFIFATALVMGITAASCFSDVYDAPMMATFWCVYNLVVYGDMMLVRVMAYEGNYIDCLMVRRENLLTLFKAKYAVYCAMLVVPFTLSLPLVIIGKWSLLMLVAFTFFTSGCQYFLLFQMAVYNKVTVPLNTKFISKSGIENNYAQLLAEAASFAAPIAAVSLLQTFFSDTAAYIVMLCLGVAFTATHKLWLRNVYKRFMARRYTNMEALRASR